VAFDRNAFRIAEMRLVGQDTELDVSGSVTLADERIDITAAGNANLGILQAFEPNIRSSGGAVLAARFTGPMREPAVSGTMTIRDGRIRHFSLPHALENIAGTVAFDQRAARLDGLSGRLGTGPVQFGGTVGIDGYRPGRFDVTMTGTSMRLRFPEGMRSLVDASLALQGTREAAVLNGQVTVRDAEYRQPFNGEGGLLDLTGGAQPATAGPTPATLPLRYDVRITAPSSQHVRNNLMLLDATADLQLQGTFDRPLLFGRAEVERGEVTFEGRRYVVTRGTIDFNNPVRIDPFIDVEAETRVRVPGETYRVTVRATGTRERFSRLTFDSDPVLPQDEVMALVFGDISPGQNAELRRYANVTPLEQLARDRAARQLANVVSSEVDRVEQQTFGVDTFQITPSLADPNQQSSGFVPGARLTIGKRLSDRAYLTYSRSLSSTTRDQIILLEYDQSDRFSWILSRNEDGTYAVDFRVRRTF
jgi:translocation and assembly module TamB